MQVTTIVLVEDDEEDVEFFVSVVHQIDPTIKVTVATSRDQLFSETLNNVPDLFFIDSFLQLDSGFDCIKEIKVSQILESVPIIMYTGSSNMQSVNEAFKAGASLYIIKPSSLTEVKFVLEQIFSLEQKQFSTNKRYYSDGAFQDYKAT